MRSLAPCIRMDPTNRLVSSRRDCSRSSPRLCECTAPEPQYPQLPLCSLQRRTLGRRGERQFLCLVRCSSSIFAFELTFVTLWSSLYPLRYRNTAIAAEALVRFAGKVAVIDFLAENFGANPRPPMGSIDVAREAERSMLAVRPRDP